MLSTFFNVERVLLALFLVACACVAGCVVSQRAQSAQDRYREASAHYKELRADPGGASIEELQAAADELAASMIELGDAVLEDTGSIAGELLGGPVGGAGGAGVLLLAAKLFARLNRKKDPDGTPADRPSPDPDRPPAGPSGG